MTVCSIHYMEFHTESCFLTKSQMIINYYYLTLLQESTESPARIQSTDPMQIGQHFGPLSFHLRDLKRKKKWHQQYLWAHCQCNILINTWNVHILWEWQQRVMQKKKALKATTNTKAVTKTQHITVPWQMVCKAAWRYLSLNKTNRSQRWPERFFSTNLCAEN